MADTLKVVLEAQDNLSDKLAKVERHLSAIGSAATMAGNIAAKLALVGGVAVGAVAAAGVGLAKNILDASNAMEQYRARLTTVLGSQQRVNQTLAFLSDFAKNTPYEIGEVTDAFVRMSAYGLQPTADKFKTIGDFAASMGRSFTDAVEAIADAEHGEFERLREFGITKEMIQNQDKNLVNAKGQITNYTKFTERLFKMMAERSAGSMERLMNTPQGKISNLKDSVQRAFLQMGQSMTKPFMNAITAITRALDSFVASGVFTRFGQMIARVFSIDHMKSFAKAAVEVGYTLKEVFVRVFGQILALVEANYARTMQAYYYFKSFFEGKWTKKSQEDYATSQRFGALKEGFMKQALNFSGIQRDEKGRMNASKLIDQVFSGLDDKAVKIKDTKPANFGGMMGGAAAEGKSAMDRITELILGGGQLARLGIKPSEFAGMSKLGPGGGRKDRIEVDVTSGESHLRLYVKAVAQEVLTDGVRKGLIAVPGGR